MQCGREQDVDFAPIRKCAIEQQGSLLLKKHGDRTHALSPKVKFIPTIELNDSQSFETQAVILKNLWGTVCSIFHDKPSKCNG